MLQRLNFAITLVSFIGVMALSVYIFFFQGKLAYVDSEKLISNYEGMIDARAAYQQKAVAWKANIDTLTSEVQQQIVVYKRESARMSAKENQLSEELIRTKQKQLMEYQQALNAQAQQEDTRLTADVVNQINAYLKKYGAANGYKIVMAATEYGNIAYADEGLDITDQVVAGLNKEYKGK